MKRYIKCFLILYLGGFGAGSLCGNLLYRKVGYQTSLLPVYFSSDFKPVKQGLFVDLLAERGSYFLLGVICGLSVFGVLLVLASLLWFGFLAGNLITIFLLEYGLKGMGIGVICFIPQIFFYIPGWMLFFFVVLQMGQKSWSRKKKGREDYKAYLFFVITSGIFILLGIWMESYVNQNLMSYVLGKWI